MEELLISSLVVTTGILIEKFKNPELTLKASISTLTNDIKNICVKMFKPTPIRNRIQFDNLLLCDFKNVLSEYMKQGTKLHLVDQTSSAQTVRQVAIGFMANRKYSTEEVLDIANYVSSTFSNYLNLADRPHIKFFVTFAKNPQNEIYFYIHYAEFEEDFEEFNKLCLNWLSRNNSNTGILRDETLEKELRELENV